jgi:hypothetical protein
MIADLIGEPQYKKGGFRPLFNNQIPPPYNCPGSHPHGPT